jgi:DNA-binding FadR family transcriptional regulator
LDEEKIAALRDVLAWEDSLGDALLDASGRAERLHLVIAELTGNPVFELFIPVLARLATRMIDLPHVERPERGSESHHAHAAIVDAIVRGDVGLAQHRLGRHLAAMAQHVSERSATDRPIPTSGDHDRVPGDADGSAEIPNPH